MHNLEFCLGNKATFWIGGHFRDALEKVINLVWRYDSGFVVFSVLHFTHFPAKLIFCFQVLRFGYCFTVWKFQLGVPSQVGFARSSALIFIQLWKCHNVQNEMSYSNHSKYIYTNFRFRSHKFWNFVSFVLRKKCNHTLVNVHHSKSIWVNLNIVEAFLRWFQCSPGYFRPFSPKTKILVKYLKYG